PNKDEVNFHPIFPGDGSELVVISSGVTTFHDAATGRESRRIAGGGYSGALSADGLRFAAGAGPQVRLWDARTGVLSHDERPSIRYGNVLWFSPDDSTLKVFGGTIQAWDCATGKLRSSVEISKYTMWFGFSPDGRHYARSGGVDRKVTVHASADDREVGQAAAMGNNTWVTSLALANDLKRLAVGDRNPPSVHVFDLETGAEIRTLKEKDGGNLAFSPDGALLAVEGKDGWIHVLNPATGELKHSLQADPFKVGALRFSPDGRRLIAATQGKGLQVWSAESGDALLGMPSNGIMGEPFMAVSPDGRYLAGPYDHRQVKVWEAATAGEVMTIDPARGYVQMLAISNGGSRLAIQTQDGNIVLWNLLSPGEDRGAAKVEELWDDLASKDAVKAYAAVCALALKGGAVAPFLKERLIHRPPDAATIRKWVRGLADEDIEARHRALSELRRVDAAADYLKIMAEKDCPAEAAAALRSLLNDAGGRRLDDADRRRRVRAIWALDRGGAPEAADLLREITEVVTDARVREEAALSLSRVHVRK
ncbi:MAG TPA: PQQ-binding-like beta-propeller repeat protein, partial [Planctomycetota bacterium]|nr:PQQ-binding-like beta-propeller repeat protein [Planctomycetota bacterium]